MGEHWIAPQWHVGGNMKGLLVDCSGFLNVVHMRVVIQGEACLPQKTRLLRAAYDPSVAASRVTARFCLGWENHHQTVTSTAA